MTGVAVCRNAYVVYCQRAKSDCRTADTAKSSIPSFVGVDGFPDFRSWSPDHYPRTFDFVPARLQMPGIHALFSYSVALSSRHRAETTETTVKPFWIRSPSGPDYDEDAHLCLPSPPMITAMPKAQSA